MKSSVLLYYVSESLEQNYSIRHLQLNDKVQTTIDAGVDSDSIYSGAETNKPQIRTTQLKSNSSLQNDSRLLGCEDSLEVPDSTES